MAGVPGTDAARDFSRTLNDHYSRGIAGQVLGTNARGAPSINPEETLKKTIGRGSEAGAVNARQLEAAAQGEGLPGTTPRTTEPEQNQYLLGLANESVDSTGRVNVRQLEKWRTNNRELIEMHPELDRITRSAADTALDGVQTTVRHRAKVASDKAVWAKVAGVEDPVVAVRRSMTGDNPKSELRAMAKAARLSPNRKEALAGLRAAFVEAALDAAGGSQKKLGEILGGGRGGGLLDEMTKAGVFSGEQRANLKKLIGAASKVEARQARNITGEDPLAGGIGAVEDLATRIIGANMGSMGSVGKMSGSGLVVASAGVRTAQRLSQKAPNAKVRDILLRAVEDPKFAAELLMRGQSRAKDVSTAQVRGYLLQTLLSEDDDG